MNQQPSRSQLNQHLSTSNEIAARALDLSQSFQFLHLPTGILGDSGSPRQNIGDRKSKRLPRIDVDSMPDFALGMNDLVKDHKRWVNKLQRDVREAVSIAMRLPVMQRCMNRTALSHENICLRLCRDLESLVRYPSQTFPALLQFFINPPVVHIKGLDSATFIVNGVRMGEMFDIRKKPKRKKTLAWWDLIDFTFELIVFLFGIAKVSIKMKRRSEIMEKVWAKTKNNPGVRALLLEWFKKGVDRKVEEQLTPFVKLLMSEAFVDLLVEIMEDTEPEEVLFALGRILAYLALSAVPGLGALIYYGTLIAGLYALQEKAERLSWPGADEDWEKVLGPMADTLEGGLPGHGHGSTIPDPFRPLFKKVKKVKRLGPHVWEEEETELADPPGGPEPGPEPSMPDPGEEEAGDDGEPGDQSEEEESVEVEEIVIA